jgi:FtsP/CotA-like multicopper oxidase with cupredoxin domain
MFACLPARPLQVPQPPEAGILGPTLLLEAGQQFEVVFQNRLDFSVNLAFDGALLPLQNDVEAGAEVPPGGGFTYSYAIPERWVPVLGLGLGLVVPGIA